MRILFDQGVPVPLRRYLSDHSIDTAYERGWSALDNGALLEHAEQDGYELLITTDQNLRHQQKIAGRPLAVLVLMSTSWPRLQQQIDDIRAALVGARPGAVVEVQVRRR